MSKQGSGDDEDESHPQSNDERIAQIQRHQLLVPGGVFHQHLPSTER